MEKLLHKHTVSFKNAFSGLWWAVSTQPNFRVHLVLSAAALFLAGYLHIPAIEFSIIIFTIVLGLSAEMINTAL